MINANFRGKKHFPSPLHHKKKVSSHGMEQKSNYIFSEQEMFLRWRTRLLCMQRIFFIFQGQATEAKAVDSLFIGLKFESRKAPEPTGASL